MHTRGQIDIRNAPTAYVATSACIKRAVPIEQSDFVIQESNLQFAN